MAGGTKLPSSRRILAKKIITIVVTARYYVATYFLSPMRFYNVIRRRVRTFAGRLVLI